MAKAVLITKHDSIYDDLLEDRYHFPRRYLSWVEKTIGDLIIYYEPRRGGGRQVYYATAWVRDVRPDPVRPGFYYAFVEHYLPFERPVPFRENGKHYQKSLVNPDGTLRGTKQNAVQLIADDEYQSIFQAGFAHIPAELNDMTAEHASAEDVPVYADRPLIKTILNRPFRDRAFAQSVKAAYDKTCAVTGLRLINGGGRAEVQAAHIKPVSHQGPDSVRNGIALCGTVHWMFDRGLISFHDDYTILKAGSGIPEAMDRLLAPTGDLILPDRMDWRPHRSFLKYHRDRVFKG